MNASFKKYVNLLHLALDVYGPQITAQFESVDDIQK